MLITEQIILAEDLLVYSSRQEDYLRKHVRWAADKLGKAGFCAS